MTQPAPRLRLSDPVQYVKGIGPVRAQALAESDVHTVADMIYYFPRRYLDRRNIVPMNQLQVGQEATVIGRVAGKGIRRTRKRKFFQVVIDSEHGSLACVWFHASDWIQDRFQVGALVAVHGKVEYYHQLQMIHPDFDFMDPAEDPLHTGQIVALYPGTTALKSTGLDSRRFRRVFRTIWERLDGIPDHLPGGIMQSGGLIGLDAALRQIHQPESPDELERAIHRLKFDEHFFLQLLMALRRAVLGRIPGRKFPHRGELVEQIYRQLPFEMTAAQVRVMRELRADFKSGSMMNRLLQGDVGSGKTILALLAAAIVAGDQAQTALMAPTELLAEQHFKAFKKFCAGTSLQVELLTGSVKKEQRARILASLEAGRVHVAVGTHALIQEDVKFQKLALIIVDEQHRFGVLQRGKLMEKGVYPHVLAMTATPIPRTLAITYHGDMDVSLLDEQPASRAGVTTHVRQPDRLEEVYRHMQHEIAAGQQCFVVYPVIDETESELKAAATAYRQLKNGTFSTANVGYLDGRTKRAERNRVMEEFQAGSIQVLVATTVIEVGIDVPNATVMVVENAERFGLTQLHQLRGRIGRGVRPGHCYLIHRGGGEDAGRRLTILEQISNGFEIADQDLKLRGAGELFGARQHGFERMRLADLATDGPIIRMARQVAFALIRQDPQLQSPEHQPVKKVLIHKYKDQLDFVSIS